MSNFIPRGWIAKPATKVFVQAHHRFVRRIVVDKARRFFNISGMDREDLIQEGMIAATYAIDTYDTERAGSGKLASYIKRVVFNSLAMVAGEANARVRNPHVWVYDGEGWVITQSTNNASPDDCADDSRRPDIAMESAAEEKEEFRKRVARHHLLNEIESTLDPLAAVIFKLKRNPPPELVVMARNICPKDLFTVKALSQYTNNKRAHVKRALDAIEALSGNYKNHESALEV